MKSRMLIIRFLFFACSVVVVQAQSKVVIQNIFNDAAIEAKAAPDPVQKREILNSSLVKMTKEFAVVDRMNSTPENDREGIAKLKASLIEKQQALACTNGQKRIADNKLNDFATYIVQKFEQADQMITISVVTLLLIIIIIILLFYRDVIRV